MADDSLRLIKEEIALKAFNSGFNCAQSVLRASSLNFDLNMEQAMGLASGFGGGMGKLQNTCGAVSGAFMSIGFHLNEKIKDEQERKEKTSVLIREFAAKFKEKHGSVLCRDLLNVDLKTVGGSKAFEEQKLGEKVCEKCICTSIEILEEILFKPEIKH